MSTDNREIKILMIATPLTRCKVFIRLLTVLVVAFPLFASGEGFELVYEAASSQKLSQPHDITLSKDQRYLYVADNNNDRIAVLDSATLELIDSFGVDELSEPHDVEIDSEGRLLVADTGNSRIAIYAVSAAEGTLVGEYSGDFYRPEGVAVHPNGSVYISGAGSNNLVALRSGKTVARADGFSSPHDVAVAPDGSVWIADAGNDRLVQMSDALEPRSIVEGHPYAFNGPRYLAFDNRERLYIADKYAHQIKVLTPDSRLLYVLGEDHAGLGPGLFDRPEGIAIHNDQVWFSDTYNNRIVRYRINE